MVKANKMCEMPEKQSIKRIRMKPELVHHFINYLFNCGSLMSAAYGTNTFLYENGSRVIVPKSVITGVRSIICSAYISFCQQTDTSHLGMSSLMKILRTI